MTGTADGPHATAGWAERKALLAQFGRFLVVGVGNTTLSFVTYRGLLALGTPYVVAAPVSFGVGALNGYIFNSRWTFEAHDSMGARVRYVVASAAGALALSLLVVFFVRVGGVGRVGAYVVAIPPVTVVMFVVNRRWTFADER